VPVFGLGKTPTKYEFVDFSPLEFAQQVILYDHKVFKTIKPWEVLAVTTKHEEQNNLDRFIALFNKMSFWVAYEVVSCLNAKKRVVLIKRFVSIAKYCKEYCDFSSLMAIISGLNMASVKRLKNTWANVPSKSIKKLEVLEKTMSPLNNFQLYRESVGLSNTPVVPFLAVHTRDIQFIEDGNKTQINGLVNFGKQIMLGCTISEIIYQQGFNYDFKVNSIIQNFLHNLVQLSESHLYKCSLLCEPKSVEIL